MCEQALPTAWDWRRAVHACLLRGHYVQLVLFLSKSKIFRQASIDVVGIQPAVQIFCNPGISYTAKEFH